MGRARPVLLVVACLIAVQLGIRGWVAARGYFYWDDLILVGRAGAYPLLSTDLLGYDHDGHFMPLAFVTAWVVTALAPLAWAGPVVSMLLLQAAASVAVARMVVVLTGFRSPWAVLGPLVFYLFCPLTIPAFAWWAAALNALPLQCALAWVIADAVLLVRTGRRRYAASGIVVSAVALLFFEKAAVVPFVAFGAAVLVRYADGRDRAIRTVARRGAPLWFGSAVVLMCWLATYLAVTEVAEERSDAAGVRALLHSATSLGIVPTLLGGPWNWARWLPSTPWAVPAPWAVALSWIALGTLVALTIRARRRMFAVWAAAALYILLAQIPVLLVRGGPNTAAELMQSLRYLADVAVVLTAVGALLLRAPGRTRADTPAPSPIRVHALPLLGPNAAAPKRIRPRIPSSLVPLALSIAFVASSLWSTTTFVRSWSISPTRTYLGNAVAAVRAGGTPLLDQEVPWDVLSPLTYPQNLASRVLSAAAPPGTFADATPRLRMFTDTGRLTDAQVWWNRAILPGPVPGCDHRITTEQPVDLPLDGPLIDHDWTAQLNYLAGRDGRITVALEHGGTVVAPVSAGLHTVYVRLVGNGSVLRIGSHTPGLDLCVGVGPVGVASYDR
ncbi:hypothetical protein NDR87_24115 [Nocardia sp. CDC159]|uniref:Uncharacterized protein n=1 Tax=Nocardia pulmonis TaxID=2951408 RepID=A0A9X2EB48_9NOCA|nr:MULTISPECIES: hypothetical protein [Nocardia]MCM6777036.1 hypothetical protein [Nocardia pulmonis]MCM6789460.1 hypothetical protein [Nocardia sp. CDC159]